MDVKKDYNGEQARIINPLRRRRSIVPVKHAHCHDQMEQVTDTTLSYLRRGHYIAVFVFQLRVKQFTPLDVAL